VRVHAPWATRYQWGYLYEALEIDGAHASEFFFVPTVDKAISAAFLRQIGELDAKTLHVVICDNAGLHPRKHRVVPRNYDRYWYRLRHLVENTILKLKGWRGIVTRSVKNASSFLAAVPI
jgi:hypothetical protein